MRTGGIDCTRGEMSDKRNRESGSTSPSVSVIVPTIGRPELSRALRSVRAQRTSSRIELILVHDGDPSEEIPRPVLALADRVIRTPGRIGGCRARNLGIRSATSQLVAFLDDDDEWLPDKLQIQVKLWSESPDPNCTVVAGRQVHVDPRNGAVSQPGPNRLIRPDETVENYLFRRRSPSGGRSVIYTSTLLCSRDLALKVPWDESLARHQDWDWLVRLGRHEGIRFVQTSAPVVRIHLGSSQSISATANWRSSIDWGRKALREDPHIYADFLVAQPLRYALASRSFDGVRSVLSELLNARQVPSLGPTIIGVAGLLPRRVIERATVSTGGKRG